MENENWIARLNEHAQKTGSKVVYEDVDISGPDHIRTFTIRVVFNGTEYPPGTGNSKKEAKKNAAKLALNAIREGSVGLQRENVVEAPSPADRHATFKSCISWLNEYGNKNKLLIIPNESINLDQTSQPQCCYFLVGDKKFPTGFGKTKKEAKEEAAKLVYNSIMSNESTEAGSEKFESTPRQQKVVSESCNKTTSPGYGDNYIGLINNYCQQKKFAFNYLADRVGEPHNQQFSIQLLINDREYGQGQGKTIKEAKQNAAQQTWTLLQQESTFDYEENPLTPAEDIEPTTPYKPETPDTDSESRPTTKGDSAMYSDSQGSAKTQGSGVRRKIKLASHFPNVARDSSKETPPLTFNSPNQFEVKSRFTSEYDSMECLGHGTFGRVYKAKEKILKKFFAVKILQCKEKTIREARALSDLHHPNIVRYYTCWIEDSGYQMDSTAAKHPIDSPTKYLYIQMELCDSKTLRVWINEKNMENPDTSSIDLKNREERLTIAMQLASGVECIHSNRFIHRDLKPPNIMFGQDRNVKIGDFGLVTDENDDAENLIDRTTYKGTPIYMAPEQKCRKTYDRKVDIFALGLIYFELLWNVNHDNVQMWEDARNQNFPEEFCHEFPHEIRIVKSMLCFQPEERPEARNLKEDIEKCTNALKHTCSDRHTV